MYGEGHDICIVGFKVIMAPETIEADTWAADAWAEDAWAADARAVDSI